MGVGMPAALYLDEFGSQVWAAFGEIPYHVGSSLADKRDWRDVDVRLILPDDRYRVLGLGDPTQCGDNGAWRAMCMAFSALGRQMTGLSIDFQIQGATHAAECYGAPDYPRSALGCVPLRRGKVT